MQISVYAVNALQGLPREVFETFDALDDRFMVAFSNYPDGEDVLVVVAYDGSHHAEPSAALVCRRGGIITCYVDLHSSALRRHDRLLRRLMRETGRPYLIVHDADDDALWTRLGFDVVAPPAELAADQCVRVLVRGLDTIATQHILAEAGYGWELPHFRRAEADAA
jgi:hypothetical protein